MNGSGDSDAPQNTITGRLSEEFTGISHDLLHRPASGNLSQTAPSTLQDTAFPQEVNHLLAGASVLDARNLGDRNVRGSSGTELTIQDENKSS